MKSFFLAPIILGISKFLPRNLFNLGLQGIGFVWDGVDSLRGQRTNLLPPFALRMQVNSTFRALSYEEYGKEFLGYFIRFCNLKKNDRVLDVGCGSGILVAPLVNYLNKDGSYEGFDINEKRINWCKKNISSSYPNFHFIVVDLYNGKYNPNGKKSASTFRFPYKGNSFDFVVLSSIFTHMLPRDLENYLSEIARVMKKNGKCLITYLLINPVSNKLQKKKLSSINFKYSFENYKTIELPQNNYTYEEAVAYEEDYIRRLYKKIAFRIDEPIQYGAWSGRKKILSKQDIIIATKV